MSNKSTHIGRKISRIRELRRMKQESLAAELGVSQQAISKIEQSEKIEEELLERIAQALGVTGDGIKKFSEEAIFNIIGNTLNNSDQPAFFNSYPTFNPMDKIVELYNEKVELMERLLASEREKVELLKGRRE